MANEALERIEELGRFSHKAQRLVALYAAIPATLFTFVFLIEGIRLASRSGYHRDPTPTFIICGIAFAFAVLGIFLYVRYRNGKRHPVYQLLAARAQEVTAVSWVRALGTGRDRLTFVDASGGAFLLLVPSHETADLVLSLQSGLLRHVSFNGTDQQATAGPV